MGSGKGNPAHSPFYKGHGTSIALSFVEELLFKSKSNLRLHIQNRAILSHLLIATLHSDLDILSGAQTISVFKTTAQSF